MKSTIFQKKVKFNLDIWNIEVEINSYLLYLFAKNMYMKDREILSESQIWGITVIIHWCIPNDIPPYWLYHQQKSKTQLQNGVSLICI